MKTTSVCTLLAAFFVASLWISCYDCEDCHWRPDLSSIQIVTGQQNDTLYFVPGDSAATTVTVVVTDEEGIPNPGQKVDISLSDPSLGVIEYTDPALMDTTNAQGRVNAVFRSYAIEGQVMISASIDGMTDIDTLVIRELTQAISSVTFETDCDSLVALPDRPDSCEICVTLRDVNNNPVVGVSFDMSATGGRFQIPPVTDENGRSCFYMYLDDGTFGDYCVIVYSDSLCFSLPG